jgi:plastocyanin
MSARRVFTPLAVVLCTLGLVACGSSGKSSGSSSGSKAPVDLASAVNDMGTKDLASATTLAMELHDNYFKPTFVKAAAGSTITVHLKSDGATEHTFTIDGTSVNQDMKPGSTATVTVNVPSSGALEFHCSFHGSLGMKGAFFSKSGDTVTNASGGSSATTGSDATTTGGGLYGG